MTITITIECDGRQCGETREIEDYSERDVERLGWAIDHRTGFQYFPKCWEDVQKEMAEE